MRKPIYSVGACALAAAAIFVWSQNAPVSSRANTASASAPAMSPTVMDVSAMHKNITALPEQQPNDMTFVFPTAIDGAVWNVRQKLHVQHDAPTAAAPGESHD